jgi:hypothetical protein
MVAILLLDWKARSLIITEVLQLGYGKTSFTGLTPFVGNQQAASGSKRHLGLKFITMTIARSYKIRKLRPAWLYPAPAQWRVALAGSGLLALLLSLLSGSGFAMGSSMAFPLNSTAISVIAPAVPGMAVDHRYDDVLVEPTGRGPQGFRYRIVVNSATRGAESSLDLAAGAEGVVVRARDIDGIGNDLDLIIESANSYAPIGIWVNDHRGGFIKAAPGAYAVSIWSENPELLAFRTTDTLCRAFLIWHQSYIEPVLQQTSGERGLYQGHVERVDMDLPSRLTGEPNQTRGPPSL